MNTIIDVSLNTSSINAAIRDLRIYRNRVEARTYELQREIADELRDYADSNFSGTIADDLMYEPPLLPDVEVTVMHSRNESVVDAVGKDAIFIEFGSGVHNNVGVGGSMHPWGPDLGYTIGSYGPKGARDFWVYRDWRGNKHYSHGVPAQMPLFRAVSTVRSNLETIARRVFSR